jgi:hypothetical protein
MWVKDLAFLHSNLLTWIEKTSRGDVLRMSYVMLQPRMINTMEIKVTCWNGGETYVAMRKRGNDAHAFVGCTDNDMLHYATTAIGICAQIPMPY